MDEFRQRISWLRSRALRLEPPANEATATIAADDGLREPICAGVLVELRRHVAANRAPFQRWYADEEIARLLRHDQRTLNALQSRSYFDTMMLPASAQGHAWGIHERSGGTLIGSSALTDFEGAQHRSAYFRILIGEKDWWGQGCGREATELTMKQAFDRLSLDEVKLEVFSFNHRAIRAYAKVGFQQTGEHREWVGRDRFELNVVEMSLYRGEFDERGPLPDFTPVQNAPNTSEV